MVLVWVALAAAGVPLVLPPSEDPADWATIARIAGFELTTTLPGPGAQLTRGSNGWVLVVRDSRGVRHETPVEAPSDATDREDLVWLATSLLDPLGDAGAPAPVTPKPAASPAGVSALTAAASKPSSTPSKPSPSPTATASKPTPAASKPSSTASKPSSTASKPSSTASRTPAPSTASRTPPPSSTGSTASTAPTPPTPPPASPAAPAPPPTPPVLASTTTLPPAATEPAATTNTPPVPTAPDPSAAAPTAVVAAAEPPTAPAEPPSAAPISAPKPLVFLDDPPPTDQPVYAWLRTNGDATLRVGASPAVVGGGALGAGYGQVRLGLAVSYTTAARLPALGDTETYDGVDVAGVLGWQPQGRIAPVLGVGAGASLRRYVMDSTTIDSATIPFVTADLGLSIGLLPALALTPHAGAIVDLSPTYLSKGSANLEPSLVAARIGLTVDVVLGADRARAVRRSAPATE